MTQQLPAQIEVHAETEPQGYRVVPVRDKKPQADYHFLSVDWDEWTVEGSVPGSDRELVVYVGQDSYETDESRRNDIPVTGDYETGYEPRDPTDLPFVVFAALEWAGIRVVHQEQGRAINVESPVPTTRLEFVDPTILTVSADDVVSPDPDPWTDRESVTVLDVCQDALVPETEQLDSLLPQTDDRREI